MLVRRTRKLLIVAVALVAAVVVDLLEVARPSPLAALGCAASIVHARPDPERLLTVHRDDILEQSALRDLPAAFLAAVLVDHERSHTTFREFTDCAGSALGANLSLGLGQLRISTAAMLEGRSLGRLSAREYRELRARLLEPTQNIALAARELRALLERPTRSPGMDAVTLLNDPAAMALVVTEYRMGRMAAAREDARLGANAFSTLALMQDGTLAAFEREDEGHGRAKARIRNYLDHTFCESGIFNDRACEEWRRSLGRLPAP